MKQRQSLPDILRKLNEEKHFADNIVCWKTMPSKAAITAAFPQAIDRKIRAAFQRRGIEQLYTHQAASFEATRANEHVVVVTPTASGKSLCYTLPVLQSVLEDSQSRALYMFPTKALAQDQKAELNEFIEELDVDIKSYTYDGDTPANIRQMVRKAGQVVMTNPDMLHSAILPHHTKWVALFENLNYVVLDELHIYRGVFGSHVANVIRRLKRICHYYGSNPVFICTSATIANPQEHAQHLTGEDVQLIDQNGAPRGKKHFVLYNPAIVNKPLNIRRSATMEARNMASLFIQNDCQTLVFARSRVRVEVILHHLRELVKQELGDKSIRGYRGGYLPNERRAIEKGLRDGSIRAVVSTNALELGVDIGQLQVCILTGYPGSIASTWQQAGRAGRREDESVVVIVGSSSPLDQYMMQHPDLLFETSPESARIHPDNLIILVDHLKCAAYELPFAQGDTFNGTAIDDVLHYLSEEQVLHERNGKWYWMHDSFPAHNISLRSASQENVVIIDQSQRGAVHVIGEMDRFSAMTLLHDEAIYLHQGIQYQVEKLDYEHMKAFVREVDVEYFTDANLAVQLKVLEVDKYKRDQELDFGYGDVTVNAMATIFKKIKFKTQENIGSGPIHLPEEELHTSATWLSLSPRWSEQYGQEKLEQGLVGLGHVLRFISALHVMCDVQDLFVAAQVKALHNEAPTVFLYDRYPGGVGLSSHIYEDWLHILEESRQLIERCPCHSGCPSCVGVAQEHGENTKQIVLTLLHSLGEAGVLVVH